MEHFHPKILLTIEDNLAVSADLSPQTKKALEELMRHQPPPESQTSAKIVDVTDSEEQPADQSASQEINHVYTNEQDDDDDAIFQTDEDLETSQKAQNSRRNSEYTDSDDVEEKHHSRTIEITLRADSEFFNLLATELASIDKLQAKQKDLLASQVKDLGREVVAVTKPAKSGSHSDLYAWREIFSLYKDAAVFFATTERDHGVRTAVQARDRVHWFTQQLDNKNIVRDSVVYS